ncbi:MAG TPA: PIN domain-containing protein [Acidimicrobiales bacterium]|nr:PIN domain-containing protein [Acidimicrobiales bacterium]
MTTVLLDTHVVHWWAAEPGRLSRSATRAIEESDELAVSAITWYELAWMARHERIEVSIPLRTWLEELSRDVRTVAITPAIADTAVSLPTTFTGGPADRIIYATAIEHGWRLITKDRALRNHGHPPRITVW